MCKRPSILISIVLVLSLSAAVQAQTTIEVNNPSFEYSCDGNEVKCHTGHITDVGEQCDANIAAWRYTDGSTGYTGIDVNCGTEDADCGNCHDWLEYPDGNANIFYQGNTAFHQITDFNIVLGHKYTMTVDLLGWDPIVLEIFALPDVNYPDANHIVISQTVYNVADYIYVDEVSGLWMWDNDLTASAVVTDPALVGKKLGIKIGGDMLIGGTDPSYLWADDVRLEWQRQQADTRFTSVTMRRQWRMQTAPIRRASIEPRRTRTTIHRRNRRLC
jgi:hypothetical protein